MRKWYDRGAKVHRSPRVTAEAQRRIRARKKREERTARAAGSVGEQALRKQRKARRQSFEWKRACYRKHYERGQMLEAPAFLPATDPSPRLKSGGTNAAAALPKSSTSPCPR